MGLVYVCSFESVFVPVFYKVGPLFTVTANGANWWGKMPGISDSWLWLCTGRQCEVCSMKARVATSLFQVKLGSSANADTQVENSISRGHSQILAPAAWARYGCKSRGWPQQPPSHLWLARSLFHLPSQLPHSASSVLVAGDFQSHYRGAGLGQRFGGR